MPKKIHSIANKNLLMAKYWEKCHYLAILRFKGLILAALVFDFLV